uniref:Uncharacterized protein n=1 Tax=Amphora coffeiformis TaxID=265554 RepID=A0A7S3P566_9STRA|mmetsp:Transcript_7222/g.13783  ORF Transcript_7222/g.13783 Transcript_7222/m.13783 type:complete len:259 (+) Transcript_7222:74-850(+)|eukprot:scaffold1267_cov171-Amphora_coffeaeformis.AAC.23
MNNSTQEEEEEEEKCSSSAGSEGERDSESYQGITILASLSSSLNDSDNDVVLSYPRVVVDPLLPPLHHPDNDNDVVEHTSDEIGTVKSDASLSLTPSMVIPTRHVHVPYASSSSSTAKEEGTTIGTLSRQTTTRTRNGPNRQNGHIHGAQNGGLFRMIILLLLVVVLVSVATGFWLGFRAGQHMSQAQQKQIMAQYLQEFEQIMADKEAQLQQLMLQRQNRALYWEIARAGSIALASSVAQVVVGPLTDYFLTEVDAK